MIEIGRFAQKQLQRTDLSLAERKAVESVSLQAESWFVRGSELGTGSLETFLKGVIQTVEIGGKTADWLEEELRQAGVNISSFAQDMLHSPNFTTLKELQRLETVWVKVQDLGLSGTPTTGQIYDRAKELGLELCPAEAGPHLRLAYKYQPLGEGFVIAMKQIADRDGDPHVFYLERDDDGLWLDGDWASSDNEWGLGGGFVFALRKNT